MKQFKYLVVTVMFFILIPRAAAQTRIVQELRQGWQFQLGDPASAQSSSFDDSSWRTLALPHDWAFESGYAQNNPQAANGGYTVGGIGWYRHQFDLHEDWQGRQIRIEFDGVYMNSKVWLNGKLLGHRPYGYISFDYDLTPHLKPGPNQIAVRVDNSKEPSARWYHGCGIYAPVRLVVTDDTHIPRDGVHVSTPKISANAADISLTTEVINESKKAVAVNLITTLVDPAGNKIASQETPIQLETGRSEFTHAFVIRSPKRWDPDSPLLYTAISQIQRDGKIGDSLETRFGVRSIAWKTDTGFWINERNIKLKGVCEHLEAGPVGAAWPEELIRWKLQLLKEMGCNAIRTAHNPQVPRFYDLCDELGLLVMDEIFDGWQRKAPEDYGKQAFNQWWERDLRSFLKRDRNHPSIVIWSLGNETRGEIAKRLVEVCHELDPSRPVTSGHSGSEFMDVHGVNGASEKTQFYKKKHPDKPFVATECPHTWQVRDYYRTMTWYRDGLRNERQGIFELPNLTEQEIFGYDWIDPSKRKNRKQIFNSSYDNATVRITARKSWELTRDLPWFSGSFRWTGFDYVGEAGYVHGGWPFRAFMGGALDLAGFEKDLYYFYQSQWTTKPMVHLLPHWTHPTLEEGTHIPVWAYSNAQEVELFHNGESLGRKQVGTTWDKMQCQWMVPWKPGSIESIAYRDNQEVARMKHQTATSPKRLSITPDTSKLATDGRDVAQLTIALVDAGGTRYPYGDNHVHFHVDGPARILSLENGNPVDVDSNYGVPSRRAFFGLNRAFLQSARGSGPVAVTVAAILGERSREQSTEVVIDCQRLMLRGSSDDVEPWTIHYTTDGSDPTSSSPQYLKPFRVEPGTTVSAVVFRAGQQIMNMRERFAPNVGLYWGKPSVQQAAVAGGDQAEDAKLVNAVKQRGGKGFRGRGYVDFKGREGAVEWYQENDGGPFTADLIFRYAAKDDRGPRTMELIINDKKIQDIQFPNTGSWNSAWKTVKATAQIRSGDNRIRLKTSGSSGVNLDEMQLQPTK